MTITPGKLRGLTQPTIVLRIDSSVEVAPGEVSPGQAFFPGEYVFAQYIGNGRLLLMPIATSAWSPSVVMASALNNTSTMVDGEDIVRALEAYDKWQRTPVDDNASPVPDDDVA